MASGIKVKSLVASTAKYTRKAAAAADTNKNGKLTRTEARALPKDLKDDFARQAKGKTSVAVATFAKDQTAYVARSASKADKNHDGVLTPAEARKMPADLTDNLSRFTAATATGAGTIGGVRLKPVGVPAALEQATSAAGLPYSAAFKGKGTDLAKMLANPQGNKAFFNELLFAATGTTYLKDYPSYYGPDGLATLSPITQAAAVTDLVDNRIEHGVDRAEFTDKMKDVMSAVAGGGAKLYHLMWTNNDDAAFDGMFAFDTKTGAIRAAGWYNEP